VTKSRSNGLSRLFNPPVFLIVLLQVRALRYAYMSIGFNAGGAVLVLLGSLVGSYFNIPVTQLPERHILSGHQVAFFGMRYVVPVVIDWPGTVVAVNVGGALIPGLTSLYLFIRHRLWVQGLLAIARVAASCHQLASLVPRLGIALPVFVPAIASVAVALLL
jgi:uncharacterized membrane protein